MIVNDLQRLRWQILDEALRNPDVEFFMGERTKTNETGKTRSLIHYINTRLRAFNRGYSCSKRMLQNDVALFERKGARLEPRFRRGHKRILRYINLEWKNPLLRPARVLMSEVEEGSVAAPASALEKLFRTGDTTPVTLRVAGSADAIIQLLAVPEVLQRAANAQNGTETVTLALPQNQAVKAMLLGLGAEVEVLAPETLRDELRQSIAAVQKAYRREPGTSHSKKGEQPSLFGELF